MVPGKCPWSTQLLVELWPPLQRTELTGEVNIQHCKYNADICEHVLKAAENVTLHLKFLLPDLQPTTIKDYTLFGKLESIQKNTIFNYKAK